MLWSTNNCVSYTHFHSWGTGNLPSQTSKTPEISVKEMQNKTEVYSDANSNKTGLQKIRIHTLTKTLPSHWLAKYVYVEKYKCIYGGKIHVCMPWWLSWAHTRTRLMTQEKIKFAELNNSPESHTHHSPKKIKLAAITCTQKINVYQWISYLAISTCSQWCPT